MNTEICILLVEDESLIADLLRDALEAGGYSVIEATSGEEAIHLLWHTEQEFAGVVTDILVGAGPNGWELAREARKRNPDVPVVYMTGAAASEWPVDGVPNSVMLQKPLAAAQLVTAISSLLNEVASARMAVTE